MFNREKIKRNLKHYAPEIIVVSLSIVAGLAGFRYIVKSMNSDELLIAVPNDGSKFLVLEWLQDDLWGDLDSSSVYSIEDVNA